MKKIIALLVSTLLLVSCFTIGAGAASAQSGDIDGDGDINSSDARLVLRYSVGLEKLNEEQIENADVNKDGAVNSADARMVLRGSVGLENTAAFGLNGSQIFNSGHYTMSSNAVDENGISFVRAQTKDSFYVEATMPLDLSSNGIEVVGKPVSIGMLSVAGKVYWVLPAVNAFLLLDDTISGEMGIDSSIFDDLIPALEGSASQAPDSIEILEMDGQEVIRYTYKNENGTASVHDMVNGTLICIRTLDENGVETAAMEVDSISGTVPAWQCTEPSTYSTGEAGMLAFMLQFAALAELNLADFM